MKKVKQDDDLRMGSQTYPEAKAQRLFWSVKEAASMLGLSPRSMDVLRHQHALYAPDGSRTTKDSPKKDSPLWSDELVRLIAFARSKTPPGVRQLTDDEALKVWKGMGSKKRREYLAYIEE